MKRIFAFAVAVLVLIGVMSGCAFEPAADTLHITFQVTHGDGTQNEYEFDTDKTTLAEVLIGEGLVNESAESSGLYDTVDGELADWNDNEAWWCFSCNGEALTVGIEDTELIDGAVYEAVLTHGFG